MVLTQALGILLEELLIRKRWLGSERRVITIPAGIDGAEDQAETIEPYKEYSGLYMLLAMLAESDDSQGHLKRVIAQFFLTNNTLVSFAVGIPVALVLAANQSPPTSTYLLLYALTLLVCLVLSYIVAFIRFRVMTKSLWATRRAKRRGIDAGGAS